MAAWKGEKRNELAFEGVFILGRGQGVCVFTFDEFCSNATVMSIAVRICGAFSNTGPATAQRLGFKWLALCGLVSGISCGRAE